MILEWDVPMFAEFPEEELTKLVDSIQENGWDYDQLVKAIKGVVNGFEDDVYYSWGREQTDEVINEIKRRIGGVQLSMFDDPFGVPEDYNEGWQ
jgi:hypothetical protein